MKLSAPLILAVAWVTFDAHAQGPCSSCEVKTVLYTHEHLSTLTQPEFDCFMATFDVNCNENVEYSEFSNEVLFEVVLTKPRFLVAFVDEDREPEKTRFVLGRLSAPIHDGLQPEECIRVVNAVDGQALAKQRILEALEASQ